MAKKSSDRKVAAAFHEVYHDEPAVVAKTRKKSGAAQAEKQKVAIALSKARAAGAKIPEKDHNPGNPGHQRPFAVSASYDVYGGHAGDAESGVCHSQPDGLSRALPKSESVSEAKCVEGTAKRLARKQVETTGVN